MCCAASALVPIAGLLTVYLCSVLHGCWGFGPVEHPFWRLEFCRPRLVCIHEFRARPEMGSFLRSGGEHAGCCMADCSGGWAVSPESLNAECFPSNAGHMTRSSHYAYGVTTLHGPPYGTTPIHPSGRVVGAIICITACWKLYA